MNTNNKTQQLDWRRERTLDTIAEDAKIILSDDTYIDANLLSERIDVNDIKLDVQKFKIAQNKIDSALDKVIKSIDNELKNKVDTESVYTKEETDDIINTKQDTLIAGNGIEIKDNTINVTFDTSLFQIVSELPVYNIKDNKIYLIPSNIVENNNVYIEYLYINGSWEKLGEVKIEQDVPTKVSELINDSLFVDAEYVNQTIQNSNLFKWL